MHNYSKYFNIKFTTSCFIEIFLQNKQRGMGQEAFCGKEPFIKNTTRSKYKVYALKKG